MSDGDRVKQVTVSTELLMRVFGGHGDYRALTSDWPADAKLRGARWDQDRRVLHLLVESATFPETPEMMTVPFWEPTFTTHHLAPDLLDLLDKFRAED